VEGQH